MFLSMNCLFYSGVKTTEKVFVRRGDDIVLNCTCFRENNGEWKGPNISSFSNHFKEEFLIPYATGLKLNPILEGSNVRVVGGYDRNTCKLLIDNFSAMNEGMYRCSYVQNNTGFNYVFKAVMICKYQYMSTNKIIEKW